MNQSIRRYSRALLVFVLLLSFLLVSCVPVVQPTAEVTPDPEPTDVPIEMQTLEPTVAPEETPAPEESAEPEATIAPGQEATPEPVLEYVIAEGKVDSSKLNMRSGPDTNYKVVDTLYREARLLIYAVDGSWLKVESVDSGTTGYVFGKYVALDGTSISAYGFGITLDDAELFKDASRDSQRVGIVPRGTGLTLYYSDKVTGYYCVSVHGTLQEGFIAPLYLGIVSRVKPSDANMEDKAGYISGNLVNFRTGPGTGYRVIDKLEKGTQLYVLGVGIDWYHVQVEATGISGYVYGKYVTLKNPIAPPTPKPTTLPETGQRGYVNAGSVNIRKGPSSDHDSIGVLKENEPVSFEGASGSWFKVSALYARLVGWVYAKYVTFPDPTQTPKLTPQPR
jgi:uncharacterized protein YraI